MKEELLIYVWSQKLFNSFNLIANSGETVKIISTGNRNHDSGPDFFNSKLEIDGQLWAGNVEMHVNSSDWIKHKHHLDNSYNNVILHVVFNHDKDIVVNDRTLIVLETSQYIDQSIVEKYKQLSKYKPSFLKCKGQFDTDKNFVFNNWINSIYISRIEKKNKLFLTYLNSSANNWEYIFYLSLARSFGLKLNADIFMEIFSSVDFSIIKKNMNSTFIIEALLYGQGGFFDDVSNKTEYLEKLSSEYDFLKTKYSLNSLDHSRINYFRTRPSNFPAIRISQFANLISKNTSLFRKSISDISLKELQNIFKVEASGFWSDHYTFSKTSKVVKKVTSKAFINNIIINTVIPFRIMYFKSISDLIYLEKSIDLAYNIKAEENTIVNEFAAINFKADSIIESQAMLYIKEELCDKFKCLECQIGNQILGISTK